MSTEHPLGPAVRERKPRTGLVCLAVALLSVLAALLTSTPARADARPVFARRLPNGLRVLICPDPAGADVSVLIRYDVGARDEPGGLEGLAHLTEHLMFTGSKHVTPGALERLFTSAGATNLNGVTTEDRTFYQETLPPERLELALWIESDRMGYLLDHLDEAAVARERATVLNEYRQKITDVPLGAVEGIALAELFPWWHPYHHTPSGAPASIAGLSLAAARAFIRTWYGPGNATITITGRADPAATMALVERYFGTLPARDPPARPPLPLLPARRRTFLRVDAQVTRREVRVVWATPPVGAPGDAELDLAATILAGSDSGWLRQRLLKAPRVATLVGAEQRSRALASVFEIRAVVAEGRTTQEVLEAIDEGLARFDGGVSEAEIFRAKLAWYNSKLFSLESSLGWAYPLSLASASGPTPPTFDGELGKYGAISSALVRATVRRYLLNAPWVATVVEPVRGAPLSGVLRARVEVDP